MLIHNYVNMVTSNLTLTCEVCNKVVPLRSLTQKYCSLPCKARAKYLRDRGEKLSPPPKYINAYLLGKQEATILP